MSAVKTPKAPKAAKAPKVQVPTDKQREILKLLGGARVIKVEEVDKKKVVVIRTASGRAVKDQPHLDKAAVESLTKKGWITETGELSETGKAARNVK